MKKIIIGAAEAFRYAEPGVDQNEYRNFLERARLTARITPNQDDANITIAEGLAETGMTDDQALCVVMSALARVSS